VQRRATAAVLGRSRTVSLTRAALRQNTVTQPMSEPVIALEWLVEKHRVQRYLRVMAAGVSLMVGGEVFLSDTSRNTNCSKPVFGL
jgi:hypothetical protein